MNDGARTRDNRNHNPGLYQLSYAHHKLARLAGFEPATLGLEGRCSIQMSYRRMVNYQAKLLLRRKYDKTKNGRGREIRTPDILLPKQARYQAALYPEYLHTISVRQGIIRRQSPDVKWDINNKKQESTQQ